MLRKLILAVFGLVITCFIAGCGMVSRPSNTVVSPSSYMVSGASSSDSTQNFGYNSSNFRCSGLSNITPQNDLLANRSGYYEVCPSIDPTNTSDIQVHGKTIDSNTICVFPANYSDSGSLSYVRNTSGSPLSECMQPTSEGAFFSFPASSGNRNGFNSVFVVEGPHSNAMSYCLSIGFQDDSKCSSMNLNYSFGKIKY